MQIVDEDLSALLDDEIDEEERDWDPDLVRPSWPALARHTSPSFFSLAGAP